MNHQQVVLRYNTTKGRTMAETEALLKEEPMDSDQNQILDPVVLFQSTRNSKSRQITATLVACLAPLSFGFALGYSSPTIPEFLKVIKNGQGLLTDSTKTWFGSLVTVGAICGGPIAALCVGHIGRKTTLMFTAVPFVFGWLLIVAASNVYMLLAGRILSGIGVGMASLASPVYIAEVATKDLRGFLGSCNQLAVVIGNLLACSLGMWLHWQWLAVAGQVSAVLLIVLMLLMPETPRWLASKGNRHVAMEALRWLRGDGICIEEEYHEIETNILEQEQQSIRPLELITNRALFRPLMISMSLMFFQQMSGINSVVFYSTNIFQEAHFGGDPLLAATIVALTMVVSTFVACVLMDRLGRKVLLLFSSTVMTLSCASFGIYYYLYEEKDNKDISWLSLVSLMVYVTAFSLGWGPIPWLIMGEIFPSRARGLASGIATCFNWTLAFIITKEFYDLKSSVLGDYGTFWLYGGVCLLSGVFVCLVLPETKGKTLEEIEEGFVGHRAGNNTSLVN